MRTKQLFRPSPDEPIFEDQVRVIPCQYGSQREHRIIQANDPALLAQSANYLSQPLPDLLAAGVPVKRVNTVRQTNERIDSIAAKVDQTAQSYLNSLNTNNNESDI